MSRVPYFSPGKTRKVFSAPRSTSPIPNPSNSFDCHESPRTAVNPEPARLRLRESGQVHSSPIIIRANRMIREAYSLIRSAGGLLMTAHAANRNSVDAETLDLCRQVVRDASCDLTEVAYKLPSEHTAPLVACLNGYPELT